MTWDFVIKVMQPSTGPAVGIWIVEICEKVVIANKFNL
jgi:hypothetical protein